MAEIQHRDIPISQNHSPFRWIVPDAAAKDAIVNFEGNGNKLLLQQDTRQIFYLREEVVVVGQPQEYSWVEIGTSIEDANNWNEAYSWGDHALVGYAMSGHTHVEADITDLDKYTQSQVDALLSAKEDTANKGVANGYASLDSTGKVPAAQLPSFVDDVEEYPSENDFPVTGEQGKLYVALDTNKVYRWSGTTYIYITSGAVDSVNNKTGVINLTTTDIPEDINLYFTEQRVRDSLTASGDINYNAATGEFSVTTYKSSDFDTDFASKSTTDLSEGTNLYHTQQRVRDSLSASGDITYNPTTGDFSATTYKSADFDNDLATKSTDDLSEGTNLYFTEQRVRDSVSASGDLSYNSASGEFSVTTYKSTDFDTDFASKSTTDLSEGTNLYHTQQRVRDSLSATGDINYNSVTGEFSATTYKSTDFDSDLATKSTTDLSEGTNLYFTEQRAKDALSTELSGKVDKGSVIVSADTTAEVNTRYHFSAAVTLTLPAATKGDIVHASKDSGIIPSINGSITYQGVSDTTLEYDFDIGINLVYDGSTWILLHT